MEKSMKIKVILISTPFLPVSSELKYGGSERIVYLLDKGLSEKNICAGVVAPVSSRPVSQLYPTVHQEVGVATILDKSQQEDWEGLYLRFEHISLAIQYANNLPGIDLVHLHDDNVLIFDTLISRPTLLTLHGDIDGFWDLALNPSLKNCQSKLVAISQSQKKIFESRGFKISYVVYNGVDESLFELADKKFNYLLSLGAIMPVKGQKNAIEVALNSGHDLILAGNIGDKTYFKEKIKPKITHDLVEAEDKLAAYLGLPASSQPKIVYVGPVSDGQKKKLYAGAKVFLMPIDWDEPFGLVMVEAMMSGTPVIAFGRGSVPEIINPNQTGYIVNNVEEMIKALAIIDRLDVKKCRQIAIKKFGKDQMVNNYIKVYKDILEKAKNVR
ncbi:MAG: glycosyltransferase [bacterium]|nr:glycosyltransferase [bacterium]